MRLEFLFVVALALYSVVIWSHAFSNRLASWMVGVFGFALACDFTATIVVCAAVGSWVWNLHTISGLASLAIMAVHFCWALGAKLKAGRLERYFSRYSLTAWGIWLVSFVSGIPR